MTFRDPEMKSEVKTGVGADQTCIEVVFGGEISAIMTRYGNRENEGKVVK